MDLSNPHRAVSAAVDTDVLVVLARSSEWRSGRELARRAGRSATGVQYALDRLVDHGLVERMEAGRNYLYRLNRDHLLAGTVEQMANAKAELLRRLRGEVGGWRIPAVSVALFGSAARDDGNLDSDIDLLVVRPAGIDVEDPTWTSQLDDLAKAVRRWTGNAAGIAEVPEPDLRQLRATNPPIAAEIARDAIPIAGELVC